MTLTDEHILPLSLGGQHILEDASCLDCADITKKFEQDVARELWGDARASYGAPSRRRKARPTHIVLSDPHNPSRKVRIPYSDYPAPMIFYKMTRAGLLAGLPETVDTSSNWQLVAITDDKRAKDFEKKHGFSLPAKFRHVPESFARLVAKVGFGHFLTELSLEDFTPLCVPYILGQKKNLSFIVGGSFDIPKPNAGLGYVLASRLFGTTDRVILIAEIRLYANNSTPLYHVVVGEVEGHTNVATVMHKLGREGGEIGPLNTTAAKSDHWCPEVWPLPYWSGQ